MKKKNIFLILVLGVLIIIAAAVMFIDNSNDGSVANIYQDGKLIRSIELSAIAREYEFTVEYGGGYNTIRVERGSICVSAADCPDGLCINQGKRPGGIGPIVCLPHRLVIEIGENAPDIDGAAG